MKIAHINFLPYDNVVGVNKKISLQAKCARDLGISMDFIVLNSFEDSVNNNLILKKIDGTIFKKKFFRFDIIDDLIDIDKYDFIVLRYPSVDFSALTFARKYKEKLITEHHTNELGEILSGKKTLMSWYRYFFEKYISSYFLSNTRGIIGVTGEIVNVELEKIGTYKNSAVISNGIDVDSIDFTRFTKFNGRELNIIFVASFFAPWHGLGRLIDGLINYSGDIKINLNLVGDLSKEDREKIENINKNNVRVYMRGRMYGKELNDLFAISTIAISTIAISTKKMVEACPLKTREYIARGIPFVYGYDDTDLNGDELFALKIEDDNTPVNIEKIIDFAKFVSNQDDISHKMRDFAKNRLDWKIKIKKMYSFILDIKK